VLLQVFHRKDAKGAKFPPIFFAFLAPWRFNLIDFRVELQYTSEASAVSQSVGGSVMQCPNCGQQMVSGRVILRSQYLARVIFSPDDVTDGFRQWLLQGTIFDRRLRPGEVTVVSKYRSEPGQTAPASRCEACGTIVIRPK